MCVCMYVYVCVCVCVYVCVFELCKRVAGNEADPNHSKGRIPNSFACRLPYSLTDYISYNPSIRKQDFLSRFLQPCRKRQKCSLKNIYVTKMEDVKTQRTTVLTNFALERRRMTFRRFVATGVTQRLLDNRRPENEMLTVSDSDIVFCL
jgi:hypothetical protein